MNGIENINTSLYREPPAVEHPQELNSDLTKTDAKLEYSLPVGATIPTNMRFRVAENAVELLLLDDEGQILKTIPPTDIQEIMRQNNIPSLGQLMDFYA